MIEIVEGENNKEVYLKIQNITRDIQIGIRRAFYSIGKDFLAYTKKKMQETKTGRTYSTYQKVNSSKTVNGQKQVVSKTRKITYKASAPGEIPLSKGPQTTTKLRKSLKYEVQGWEQLEYSANTEYAKWLEKGTTKMAARPYLKPTILANLEKASSHFKQQIDKKLNG